MIALILLSACSKMDSWLDEKETLSDSRPTTLEDMRAILDYAEWMNYCFPDIGNVSADHIYLDMVAFNSAPEVGRNAYTWADIIFDENLGSADWTYGYRTIAHANIVLDGLTSIQKNNANTREYDGVKGTALFFRAFAYYGLAQLFCKPYSENASDDLGLPIRTTSDININPQRSSLKATYDRMIKDLEEAIPLLPDISDYQTRPTKLAAWGLLAKIYLCMENYGSAEKYADMTLESYDILLDFNDSTLVSTSSVYRFPSHPDNPEILFWAASNQNVVIIPLTVMIGSVDQGLYKLYDDNDLRKKYFYFDEGDNKVKFRGTYSAINRNFAGIATNEILLIRAECLVRNGNVAAALADLNTLLEKRYLKGTFESLAFENPDNLLIKILEERRKELPYTGQVRWEDLRRLNKTPRFAKTLTKEIDGTTYSLPPNSPRYVYPIPPIDVQLSNLQQNER
ncbi:RagB/SusD family nutrient uptake outer membrane protein [Sinomicrobium weinanense]|uniref:RagB/SusD family nutrient uptake outer membrane protein n=1 Tax=Sinomicrobium weinanense TaxID=2842200 RepID=A0A926JRC3_9FLAO|nr:RagB/SusD family nutrient uptake outer membrane protein [Sinomicrobium weinanense]MBC9795867.1 RagB/SusD family nutrient uptake outer membrane protein [Sinomicrobium weinanense]MBU3125387.1 RagB/SusD family nutrient uptake outer membrane protein [Sinomicrobium weinanense]